MSNPESPETPEKDSLSLPDQEVELASESADVSAIIGGGASQIVGGSESKDNSHYLFGSKDKEGSAPSEDESTARPVFAPLTKESVEASPEPAQASAKAEPAAVSDDDLEAEILAAVAADDAKAKEKAEHEAAAKAEAAKDEPKEDSKDEPAPEEKTDSASAVVEKEASKDESKAEPREEENPLAAAAKDDTLVQRRRLLSKVPTETADRAKSPEWSPRVLNETEKPPTKEELQSSIFEGATVVPTIPSRKAAHAWAFLIGLVMTPITWYLVADSGARLIMRDGQWDTLTIKPFIIFEVFAALVCLLVLVLSARWSSVGAFVSGVILLVVGTPFLVIPARTSHMLEPVISALKNFNAFGGNVAHHLLSDGSTARFIFYGFTMLMIGIVSHGARRKGRKDAVAFEQVEESEREQKQRGRRKKTK